jgi:hypothetical protein
VAITIFFLHSSFSAFELKNQRQMQIWLSRPKMIKNTSEKVISKK